MDRLLDQVRGGDSRVLVLRGEPGAGKTALLDYVDSRAGGCRVLRAAGVEPEAEIAYAGLQQLTAPLSEHLDRLPAPQQTALSVALGRATGEPPDAFLLGLGLLGLLAEAAAGQPLVVLVDDVQWFDRMSAVILHFAARRLAGESVALLLAGRPGEEPAGLPELPVGGLGHEESRALLSTVLIGPLDDRVRDRIVAETRGNPLALLELPRGLTPAELSFGLGVPDATPVGTRVAATFRRRIDRLPAGTRTLLATAAVEPTGDPTLLWRALERLGVSASAAAPAEAAGLLEVGARVRFRHPLVRSAAWRALPVDTLREVHRALAEVTDPVTAADRRAWHRAHAAGGPDEEVAAELERAATAALARGGRVAAAAFLERAVELSPDPARHAARALAAAEARAAAGLLAAVPALLGTAELGPLDPLGRASVARLRARLAGTAREAVPRLIEAARELAPLDAAAARETALEAIAAGISAGRLGADELPAATGAARELPGDPLLDGLAGRLTGGTTQLRAAGNALSRLPLLVAVAADTGDVEAWQQVTVDAVRQARESGAIGLLPLALAYRAEVLIVAGELTEAAALLEAAETAAELTGQPAPVGPALGLAAVRGQDIEAAALIEVAVKEADVAGTGRLLGLAGYAKALLDNGLGRYATALEAARAAAAYDDLGLLPQALTELVEAATRADEPSGDAVTRLAERARRDGTPWARGQAALAEALTGAGPAAEDGYRRAIEKFGDDRLRLPRARARLLYGEWLRRENRRTEAREHLRAAHEALAAMGADGFAGRARRELAATGETVRRRTEPARWDLTPQETQIVRLVVAGQTNPEIGAELFLSPRTVEWHLRKVFGKVGVANRRELRATLRNV